MYSFFKRDQKSEGATRTPRNVFFFKGVDKKHNNTVLKEFMN